MCILLIIVANYMYTFLFSQIGGMKEGDYLVGIGDGDVKWNTHAEVVTSIKGAGNSLKLRLVTPLNRSKTSYSKSKVSRRKN